jgi:haloalkane dehalogenase
MQDWGGPTGVFVAQQRPERVRALVFGNTWCWPVDDDPHFVNFSRAMGGRAGGVLIRRFNAFVNLMIPLGTRRRRLTHAEMRCYRRPFPTAARREATHILPREITGSTPYLRRLHEGMGALADKPALLLWGDRDIAFRAQDGARLAAYFKDAQVRTLAGAGHYVQEDAPEEMDAALRDWWTARLEPDRAAAPGAPAAAP